MLGGVLSWFATNFVGQPIIRFYGLRNQTRSSLIFCSNVGPIYERTNPKEHPDWERWLEAETTYRRLASELRVLALNYPKINRFLIFRGYQLEVASAQLIGLSNSIGHPEEMRRRMVDSFRDKAERSLKLFPLTYPDGVKVKYD
jgi:hypothetical protein